MTDDSLFQPPQLPSHESAVRRLMAEATGASYQALESLAEAQAAPDGVVILEGDDGGQVYLTVPARLVRCSEQTLATLLADLDAHAWQDLDSARVFYERRAIGAGVGGGIGGGHVVDGVWIHPDLRAWQAAAEAVIAGEAEHLGPAVA